MISREVWTAKRFRGTDVIYPILYPLIRQEAAPYKSLGGKQTQITIQMSAKGILLDQGGARLLTCSSMSLR